MILHKYHWTGLAKYDWPDDTLFDDASYTLRFSGDVWALNEHRARCKIYKEHPFIKYLRIRNGRNTRGRTKRSANKKR